MNIQEVKLPDYTKDEILELMQKDFIRVDEDFYAISKLSISVWNGRENVEENGTKFNEVDLMYFFPKKYQEEYNLIMNKLKDSERQRQELQDEVKNE
jgi:hypothetical protein